MAVVFEKIFPGGWPKVRIHDDDIEPDQAKAWAHAYEVHGRIHFENKFKRLKEEALLKESAPKEQAQ